jgi:hypothetical protein
MSTAIPAVYKAISKVAFRISKEGIAKARNNQAQGYKFRGIDDVYNALAPILAGEQLCILPVVTERSVVERVNQKGTALFYVTVKVDFTFVSAEDGSSHVVTTYGEAMDSGDKATNKAMSAAYKYAAMQAFCIPTEGDNDADATTHETAPAAAPELLGKAREAALKGLEAYAEFWKSASADDRAAIGPSRHADLKELAKEKSPV